MPGSLSVPDDFLLAGVQTQHGYKDEKSLEVSTGIRKRKYKLAGNAVPTLGVYTFFVLTSKEQSCERNVTLSIHEHHWENRKFIKGTSYLDLKRIEALTKDDLIVKLRDTDNKLQCIGKLEDSRYGELQGLTNRTHMTRHPLPINKQNLIKQALDAVGISDTILKNLDLA